jgi:hypothetical protein
MGSAMEAAMRSGQRRVSAVAIVVLALLPLTGCATMTFGSRAARGAEVTQYRTWEWGTDPAGPTGDPRIDSNPFFQDRVREAVEHQLTTKGFVRSKLAGPPDLLVHYHVNFSKTVEVSSQGARTGSCSGDCGPEAYAYEQGTLVVEVIDAHMNVVVWRGWSRDNMEGTIDDQTRMEREIDAAVGAMFKSFPSV